MTFARYSELNELADRLLFIGHDAMWMGILRAEIDALSMRERKVLNGMVFHCGFCGKWSDHGNSHGNARACTGCGKTTA